jgi:hypothetical protein
VCFASHARPTSVAGWRVSTGTKAEALPFRIMRIYLFTGGTNAVGDPFSKAGGGGNSTATGVRFRA